MVNSNDLNTLIKLGSRPSTGYLSTNKKNKKRQKKLNIDIENLLSLPGAVHIYWKNLKGHYLGCNDLLAEHIELNSRHAILNKTDYELAYNKDEAKLWRLHDNEVVKHGVAKNFHHPVTLRNIVLDSFDLKLPLINNENQICGVLGISYLLSDNFLEFPKKRSVGYSLDQFRGILSDKGRIQFSKRQLECLHLLIQGKSAKEIGKILQLSYRTVEIYITIVKVKFNCRTRLELISKIHRLLLTAH